MWLNVSNLRGDQTGNKSHGEVSKRAFLLHVAREPPAPFIFLTPLALDSRLAKKIELYAASRAGVMHLACSNGAVGINDN